MDTATTTSCTVSQQSYGNKENSVYHQKSVVASSNSKRKQLSSSGSVEQLQSKAAPTVLSQVSNIYCPC